MQRVRLKSLCQGWKQGEFSSFSFYSEKPSAEPEGYKMLNLQETLGGIKDHFIPCLSLYWKQGYVLSHFFKTSVFLKIVFQFLYLFF